MQNPWLQIRQEIAKKLKVDVNIIEEPENFGDLAYPCFSLAKKFKEAPQQIAAKLAAVLKGEKGVHDISAAKTASRINSKLKYIKEIKALGPYINFYIDWEQFTPLILKAANKNFGKGKEKKKIMIDTYSANPF